MTEPTEAPQGQPVAEAKPVDVLTAPPQEPAQPEAKEEVTPPKYGGKTMEDLLRELEEKDRYVSEVNERAARAEHEALLTRNLVEQFARERGKPQEPAGLPDEPPIGDEDILTNPKGIFTKGFQWMEAKMRAERERERMESYVSQARTAYETGRDKAFKSDPNLFRGIETRISNEMFAQIQNSLKAGQPVDPRIYESEKYWKAAALAMRVYDGEDVSKYFTKTHTPMAPVHQETPTPGAPPQGRPPLSEEARMGAKFFGVTEDQWAAADQALKEKK